MSILTLETIRKIVGKLSKKQVANANSFIDAVNEYGPAMGLDQPHRIAQFLAQILHESAAFNYDREIWGPTPAQKKYEGRKDLGNTQKGDGSKFRGHGPIQVTGRGNTTRFWKWCVAKGFNPPDFRKNPELINTDPWEGLSALWYWDEGNPEGKSLNRYADQGDIEMITKRINGGLNGYQDRLDWYAKVALVLLGYGPKEIEKFQEAAKARGEYEGTVDDIAGPKARSALHQALVKLTKPQEQSKQTQAAPVVVKEETKVVPPKVEKEVKQKTNWLTNIFGGTGLIAAVGTWLGDADWQTIGIVAGVGAAAALAVLVGGQWMVRRIKAIRAEVEAS